MREGKGEREREIIIMMLHNCCCCCFAIIYFFYLYFNYFWNFPKLLADSLLYSRGPLVVRGPPVENHCFRGMIVLSCIAIQNEIT